MYIIINLLKDQEVEIFKHEVQTCTFIGLEKPLEF
jgi:hypothetical protein